MKNSDFSNESDNGDSEKYLENQRNRIRQKELKYKENNKQKFNNQIEKNKKRKKVKKKMKEIYLNTRKNFLSFLMKVVDPNVLIAGFASYHMVKHIDRMDLIQETQQSQIEQIQAKPDLQSQIKNYAKKNLEVVIITGTTIGIPIAKHAFRHWQVGNELKSTTAELSASQQYVEQMEQNLLTQSKKTETHIGKLHVTLNRLNTAVFESVSREKVLSDELTKTKKELTEIVQAGNMNRDEIGKLNFEIKTRDKIMTDQAKKIIENSNELQEKERQEIKLNKELKILIDNDSNSLYEIKSLEREIARLEQSRSQISNIVNEQNVEIQELAKSKEKTENKLIQKEKSQKELKEKSEKLKSECATGKKNLKAAKSETNVFASKIGKMQKKVNDYAQFSEHSEKEMVKLDKKLNKSEEMLSTAQEARSVQENKFNETTKQNKELVNDLLNQQETDQKKSLWNLFPSLSISLGSNKPPEQTQTFIHTSGYRTQGTVENMSCTQRLNHKTKKWEIEVPENKLKKQQLEKKSSVINRSKIKRNTKVKS